MRYIKFNFIPQTAGLEKSLKSIGWHFFFLSEKIGPIYMTLSVQRCLKTLWFPCECKHIWSLYEIHSMNILSTFIIEKLYILVRKNVCTEQYGSVKLIKLWSACWDVFINSQFCVYSHVYFSWKQIHYSGVIMSAMASHNTGVSIVYLTVFIFR